MAALTTLIVSINICSIQSQPKLALLRSFIIRNTYDIVLLQEVSVASFGFYGYKEVVNQGPDRRGTAILYKENLPLTHITSLSSGRGVRARFGHVTIINIYAPSGSQNAAERSLFYGADIVPLLADVVDDIILAGDFNCVLRQEDCLGRPSFCGNLRALTTGLHLKDPVVHFKRPVAFTYRHATAASRLDRYYISDRMMTLVKSYHEHPVPFSDHMAVACHVQLAVEYAPRGPSYWKMDTNILRDSRFLPEFREWWQELVQHQRRFPCVADWWERYAKNKLKVFCRVFTKQMYREENEMTAFYEQCLRELYAQPPSPGNLASIREVKADLVLLSRRKLDGLTVRSKCDTHQEGEMATVYHVVRRHARARSRAISSLRAPEGVTLNCNRDMLAHAKEHFTELFAHPMGPSCAPLHLQDITPLISAAEAEVLAADLTVEELQQAVAASPRGKCPGPDGLPAEFYAAILADVQDTLLQVFVEVLARGRMCESQGQGVVVLVPKTPHSASLSEYRPLTMLNADYKILARVINKRMLPLLPQVLDPAQVGPGTDRDITASLCDVRDTISHHELTQDPAALVSIDLAGAFNHVHHDFLFHLLERLGFGDTFVSWLRCLYTGCSSQVEINGFLSARFPIHKSVRQGGPESMTLFIIAMMPLIRTLSARLAGSVLPRGSFKVSNYVDDTQALLRTEAEAQVVLETLDGFHASSGLRINILKSKALALGSWDADSTPLPFPFVNKTRILGVQFSPVTASLAANNWPAVVSAAKAVLINNSGRQLCLEQRVRFVNVFAMSKLWYIAKVVPPDPRSLTSLRIQMRRFVWTGWFFTIAYPVLCLPIGSGGFGLHDPVVRCKALFYSRWFTLSVQSLGMLSGAYLPILRGLFDPPPPSVARKVHRACPHYAAYTNVQLRLPPPVGEPLLGQALIGHTYATLLPLLLPTARVRVQDILPQTDWKTVWSNVQSRRLLMRARSAWFAAVHDIYKTNARLHAIGQAPDDKCVKCGRWDTILHRLTTCGNAATIWRWYKDTVRDKCEIPADTIQQDFLIRPDVTFPSKQRHNTIMWLSGHVVMAVLSEDTPPTLAELLTNTLTPIRAQVLTHSSKYIEKTYGKYLANLF